MYRTFGAPSGAFGGRYGVQSGTESRMSRAILPLCPFVTTYSSSSQPLRDPTDPQSPLRRSTSAGVVPPLHARPRCDLSEDPAIVNHVRHDQRERKEQQAQEEVPEEAVALSTRDARRPETQRHPNDEEHEAHDPPSQS